MSRQAETPLADAVEAFLADTRITPFTTPGHKRSPELVDALLRCDLPLSAGADDLRLSGDVLGRAERLAAELWQADFCRFCLNGSTQGNQALALGVGEPADSVVVTRGLHKSLFMGLVLAGLEPVWVTPELDERTGLALGVPASRIEAALAAAPGARAVFLVEPSMTGSMSDVEAIARLCGRAGIPLIVDQAWGAHLGFHPDLPRSALALGADAMVTSAHKTLAAFTQGAFLFAREGLLDLPRLDRAFEALATTSPSAAILASLDRTRALVAERGEELLDRTVRLVAGARRRLEQVSGLELAGAATPSRGFDPTRLALSLPGTGADGLAVERDLVDDGLRLELSNRDLLLPLVTIGDTEETVDRLTTALVRSIERHRGAPRASGAASIVWALEPRRALSPRTAFFARRETVPAGAAPGRISAETVVPYPPGIPAIAPGEIVDAAVLAALREEAAAGTRLAYCSDPSLAELEVVASS